jgi:hypothetical protein
VYIDELSGRHGIMYVAEKELGTPISEETAKKVLEKVKASFSSGARRSSFTPDELKEMIAETEKR